MRTCNLGRRIDAHDIVVRIKHGHELMQSEPNNYGTRMDCLCSTLKTWRPYWKLKLQEWWGYRNFPTEIENQLDKLRLYFDQTYIRTEFEAVDYWLGVYRGMADVRSDHTNKWSKYAAEGDEPWCSTGMGAIIIAAAGYRPDTIRLVGYDNMWSGRRDNFESVMRERSWSFPPHAWNIEKRILPMIAEHYGVEIAPL